MKHIEAAWQSYLKEVVNPDTDAEQMSQMREVFFDGALSVAQTLFVEGPVVDILQEMKEYKLELAARLAIESGLPNRVIVSQIEATDGWTIVRLACGHEFSFITSIGAGSPAPCAQCISDYIAKSKRSSL